MKPFNFSAYFNKFFLASVIGIGTLFCFNPAFAQLPIKELTVCFDAYPKVGDVDLILFFANKNGPLGHDDFYSTPQSRCQTHDYKHFGAVTLDSSKQAYIRPLGEQVGRHVNCHYVNPNAVGSHTKMTVLYEKGEHYCYIEISS